MKKNVRKKNKRNVTVQPGFELPTRQTPYPLHHGNNTLEVRLNGDLLPTRFGQTVK